MKGFVRLPSGGSVLERANVLLEAGPRREILGAATTDGEGGFQIAAIPAADGTVFRLRAEDPATLRRGLSPAFVVESGEVKNVDVVLRAIGSVTGVLRTFDGTTVLAGAEVDVTSTDEGDGTSPPLRVSTGADGRYRADGVPAGAVAVSSRIPVTGLSARAAGRLESEGEVLELDLAATPTGRVRGAVLSAGGSELPGDVPAPEVRLEAGATRETLITADYDFSGVDATGPFVLTASERVEPFHAGLLRGRAVAGQTVVADTRYAPFGTLRVRVVKPDPERHGNFLPATGVVTLYCGEPYAFRFPCGAPVGTDAAGAASAAAATTSPNTNAAAFVFISLLLPCHELVIRRVRQ